jgi:hypothetical protein
LGNAAVTAPAYVLIDEPELNLHPSLQLDFLATLAAYAKVGVVFSTHSIGLARSIASGIHSFQRSGGECRVTDFESLSSLSEFLGELSFSSYQTLGFDRVLLVEGPTDVAVVQQFLRKLKKEQRILLLPMGGGTMIRAGAAPQLEEVKRITTNVAALIDSERGAAGAPLAADREAFVKACADAQIQCHVLARRATDNYLVQRAIEAVKGTSYRELLPFERLSDVQPAWAKNESWRIARAMEWREVETTDFGGFLSAL